MFSLSSTFISLLIFLVSYQADKLQKLSSYPSERSTPRWLLPTEAITDPEILESVSPVAAWAAKEARLIGPEAADNYTCSNEHTAFIWETDPLVLYVANFLQPGEAEHLIRLAAPIMQQSQTISSPNSSQSSQLNEGRVSSSAFLDKSVYRDRVVRCIEERAGEILGKELDMFEPLQVVWYKTSQQYRPHFDWFPPESTDHLVNGGNRHFTIFVYLNDAAVNSTGHFDLLEGGGTEFPELKKKFQPVRSDAVIWNNLLPNGDGNPKTLHAGTPVNAGEKYGLNIWTRERSDPRWAPFEVLPDEE